MTFIQEQIKRQMAMTSTLVIGLDTDDAGRAAVGEVARQVLAAEVKATALRVITWPATDVNAWLQDGGSAEDAEKAVAEAAPFFDYLLAQTDAGADDAAVRELFRVLAGLDVYEVSRWREKVCKVIDLGKSEFDALLKIARREAGMSEDGKPKYMIVGNRVARRYYDRGGAEVVDVLAHFAPTIGSEVIEDDGSQQVRKFIISGLLPSGEKLPEVEVDAKDFSAMSWVLELWGMRALIEAGGSTKDHLRAAMQMLHPNVPIRYIYSHMGWRRINAQMVYLGFGGAVGYDGIEVRATPDLARYRLPLHPENAREAMATSLRFWEVGDWWVTIPLWAAMFLAPLCSIMDPTFTMWVFGTTGSMKSTITALALCHFGHFAYNTPPASWTGTTNALEKKAFLLKDAPLWIDDYVPQSTFSGNAELKRKVDQLLRDWGNRAGRSRMGADLSLRQTFAPRGLIISTAEQLPPGQSIQARLFQVEVKPDMITRGAGSALTVAQAEAGQYQHAMAGYLLWLAGRYAELERTLPEQLLTYTEKAREKGAHLRMPVNVAQLYLGLDLGMQYAEHVGAIDAEQAAALRDCGWNVLVGLGEAQQVAAQEEKPVEMYITAIQEMIAQGSAYLRRRSLPDVKEVEYPPVEKRQAGAEFIGWYGNDPGVEDNAAYADSRYWFLIPGVTFKAVAEFYRQSGIVFPDSARGIKAKLLEQKRLIPGENRGFDYQLSPSAPRVLRVIKDDPEEE